MDLDAQIDWYARGCPGHLRDRIAGGCPEYGLGEGGHGEPIAIGYRLMCRCSETDFAVTVYRWRRDETSEEALLSPVSCACTECGRTLIAFDTRKHGYNPVACGDASEASGEDEPSAAKEALSTTKSPAKVDVISYYPDDLFGSEFDSFADRRHDLFTWLRIVLTQEGTHRPIVLEFECA